jgi:hypothetical protein
MCIICKKEYHELDMGIGMVVGCEKVKEIPKNIKSKELLIKNCKNLRKISHQQEVKHLVIEDCEKLEKIEDMLCLTTIFIENCPLLTSLPQARYISRISCRNCPSIRNFYNLGQIEVYGEIYLENCGITDVSNIRKSYLLCILNCPNITQIEEQSCIQLVCDGCENLRTISLTDLAVNLSCKNCTNLVSITGKNLVKIDCEDCTSLVNITVEESPEKPFLIYSKGCVLYNARKNEDFIILLQRRYRRKKFIKLILHNEEFARWFYNPQREWIIRMKEKLTRRLEGK